MEDLIVTGFTRSGTTALTDLINRDGRLFVTYERWSYIVNHCLKYVDPRFVNRTNALLNKHGIGMHTSHPKGISNVDLVKMLKAYEQFDYVGDKVTRPVIRHWERVNMNAPTAKIILCIRDPRDIMLSEYWARSGQFDVADIMNQYIYHMELVRDVIIPKHNPFIVKYEDAVMDPDNMIVKLSDYLELDTSLNIEGHDYRPVHINRWQGEVKNSVLPYQFVKLMEYFGYER